MITYKLLKLTYVDNWFKFITNNFENTISLINFPEYFFISDYFIKSFIIPFSSEIDNILYSYHGEENFLNPIIIVPHLLVIGLFMIFFITLYFSYYSSSIKEEVTIDHDFLIANTTVEAEEEIGSLDDMLLSIIILSFIFMWYFYINC
jgi:hypothetical protein